jgi:hypothetical protein
VAQWEKTPAHTCDKILRQRLDKEIVINKESKEICKIAPHTQQRALKICQVDNVFLLK